MIELIWTSCLHLPFFQANMILRLTNKLLLPKKSILSPQSAYLGN